MEEEEKKYNDISEGDEKKNFQEAIERVLSMNPSQLVEYLTSLEKEGRLEEFLEFATDKEAVVAQLSYWEKWLEEDHRKLVDSLVEKKKKIYGKEGYDLPLGLERRFNEEELKLIFSSLFAIQLTFGCSKGCPFCGFDAVPGVREHIPYFQLANLFQRYGSELNRGHPFLYWASEPCDYASRMGLEDKTYQDVHQLAITYAGYSPHITSREFANSPWLEFLGKVGNSRISVFGLRDTEEIERKIEKNIELIGKKARHQKGIGLSRKEIDFEPDILYAGIGCSNGVLLTPRGIYNVVQIPCSEEFPQGQIVAPIEELSDEKVKVGDRLKDVLRKKIVVYDLQYHGPYYHPEKRVRYHLPDFPRRTTLLITSLNTKQRIWFNKDGIVTGAEDYSEKEQYFEDNFEEIITKFLEKQQKEGREIEIMTLSEGSITDLTQEQRDELFNKIKAMVFNKLVIERRGEKLMISFYAEISGIGGIWASFEYSLKKGEVGEFKWYGPSRRVYRD